MHRLLFPLIAITGISTTSRAQCPPEHLDVSEEVFLGCWCNPCNCAQQGVAADPAGNAFFTSTGATKAKSKLLVKFDSNWNHITQQAVNYNFFIDHIGDIAVVGNFVYAPLQGNTLFGDDINLLHVAWFDKNTLEHVGHTDVIQLDTLFGIGDGDDGGLSGVAHQGGKLYVLEYQKDLPDSPTPHIFIFDLLPNGALDLTQYSAKPIPTRYANGIEIVGDFALVSYGSTSGPDAGSIDVYRVNDIGAGPIFTWTFDVDTYHAQGLTFANGKLWVAQGNDVYRLNTNNAPAFPEGLIQDCFGNCAPADWVGDGICDDGWDTWDGNLIHFDCEEFGCDGGDCDCGKGGSDYTFCCSAMCLNVDEDPPLDCFDATPTVGIDDDRVYAWFRLSEICVPIYGARWEWFRPDGSLWGDETSADSCSPGGGCAGPCTWSWWIPIAGTGNADWDGVWQVKMYVDAGSGWEYVATEQFVMSYNVTDYLMCEDVQNGKPYEPINPTNTFYQTSEKAVSWVNLDLVANSLDVRWTYYEPDGSLFYTTYHTIPDSNDNDPPDDYWDSYRTWGSLLIDGYSTENKCGSWEVKFDIKDPFGNWELEYSDGFVVLEDPSVAPTVTVVSSPEQPVEGEPISLIVCANDNTYLHHVTLSWFDDQWHDVTWDEIFAGKFDDSHPIGSFPEGQEIMFFAEAVDTSGNATVTETETIIVQPPLCGNGVIDPGEDCENCPEDVICPPGTKCIDGRCSSVNEIIFDNGPPDWSAGVSISPRTTANRFILAFDSELLSVIFGFFETTRSADLGPTLLWFIYDDDNNQPGSTLAQGAAQNLVITEQGFNKGGWELFLAEFNLEAPVTLMAETPYWLGLNAPDASFGEGVGWTRSAAPGAGSQVMWQHPGGDWTGGPIDGLSFTLFGMPCPWDLDGSNDVGVGDLLILLGVWGPCPPKGDCPADFRRQRRRWR